jgi:hypothetical protein
VSLASPEVDLQIYRHGWAAIEFDMPQADRDEFARLGRDVIVLASEEPQIREALTFELDETLIVGSNNPTLYGISKALNSNDDKIWLHAGYQTPERFAAALGKTNDPTINGYFDALQDVLSKLENGFVPALESLSQYPEAVEGLFFPDDISQRVMHVRTVRYLGLDEAEVGSEVFASHADMSFASMQFYETHAGYLRGAPMRHDMVRWDADIDRIEYIVRLTDRMQPIEYDGDNEAAFFLGAGVKGLNDPLFRRPGRELPVLYHGGFRPEINLPKHRWDEMSDTERVTTVAFLHPRLDVLRNGRYYRLPSVETCRPMR